MTGYSKDDDLWGAGKQGDFVLDFAYSTAAAPPTKRQSQTPS